MIRKMHPRGPQVGTSAQYGQVLQATWPGVAPATWVQSAHRHGMARCSGFGRAGAKRRRVELPRELSTGSREQGLAAGTRMQ